MAEPVCIADYEQLAEEKLSKYVRDYFNSGANYEQTYRDNTEAFKRFIIRPKYMRDVSKRSTKTTILGAEVNCPIGVSPMAMCRLAHPEGEVAIGQACDRQGRCFTLSTMATTGMREIAEKAPSCLRWMQIHVMSNRETLRQLVHQAEECGFSALALTVDCPMHGRRYAEMRNKFRLIPSLRLEVLENLRSRDTVTDNASKEGWGNFINSAFSSSATWDDLRWLKTITTLPVVAKGILTGESARDALAAGADAIWVSNHGGRELDCIPSTIDALSEVVAAVDGRCEVYLDGGVRSGLDVFKAFALGARAVFVGRPLLWGIAVEGSAGAEKVLEILRDELDVGMGLAGAPTLDAISRDMVVHESYYKSRL